MTTRKETIVIPEEACVIWDILVDFEKYPRWRENVNEVKMIDEKHYQEFNREGYQTNFCFLPGERKRKLR